MMRNLLMILMIAVVIAGCQSEPTGVTEADNIESEAVGNEVSGLAVVNGEPIYQEEVDQLKQQMQENESVILEQLIAQKLLLQEAEKQGIQVRDQKAEEQISTLLQEQGMTVQGFKSQVGARYETILEQQKDQIMLKKLAAQSANLSVSDQELQMVFEQNSFENMTYSQVEPQLREMIKQQKEQQVLGQLAQQLRSDAEIEYN